jgi:uncharacterized membrane protein YedE/YeeE
MNTVLLGLFSGIAFGFVIQRIGATNPDKMARAHLMIEPQIPQFMLGAVLISAIGLFGLQSFNIGKTVILPTSIVATGVAGLLFGIGWGLAGYCPGTIWAASGEGRLDAVFALLGGFAGTAVFAHLHERLIPMLYMPTNAGKITLHDWVVEPAVAVVLLAAVFGAGIWVIGRLWGPAEAWNNEEQQAE